MRKKSIRKNLRRAAEAVDNKCGRTYRLEKPIVTGVTIGFFLGSWGMRENGCFSYLAGKWLFRQQRKQKGVTSAPVAW